MAWKLGDGVLKKGEPLRFSFQVNNYSDVGAQFAIARPSYAPSGSEAGKNNKMSVSEYSMLVGNGKVQYSILITNTGPQNASLLIYGGGVV